MIGTNVRKGVLLGERIVMNVTMGDVISCGTKTWCSLSGPYYGMWRRGDMGFWELIVLRAALEEVIRHSRQRSWSKLALKELYERCGLLDSFASYGPHSAGVP